MTKPFKKMTLIGIGLIGASIAQAARRHGLVDEIVAVARQRSTLDEARSIDLADDYMSNAAEAVKGADLVILCTPVGAFERVMQSISAHLEPGAILTDVGSVKGHVHKVLRPLLPDGVHLVPGHPMAGTEHSGPLAGFPELFENRWCILTPEPDVDRSAIDRLADFWRAMGSNVDEMSADHHDLVVAITSHVPHLVAYNIVGTADDLAAVSKSEVIQFSAGGFRDFTRIAASDPVMWRDVFLTNREAVLEMLGRFLEDLSSLQRHVRNSDGDALESLFTRTRAIRRSIIDAGQETDAPNFGRAQEPHRDGSSRDGNGAE